MKNSFPFVLLTVFTVTLYLQFDLLQDRFKIELDVPGCSWCDAKDRDEVLYLPANTLTVRLGAPADPDLLADLFWLRACYYFGSHALTDRSYVFLYYLLDRITDLAPRWDYPYLFGAIVLYLEASNPHEAIMMVNKGLKHFTDYWELMFLKGYILWKEYSNLEAASTYMLTASQMKGAPGYLSVLSATLATRTGEKEFTDHFFNTVMKVIKDPFQRGMIQKKISEMKIDE